MKLLRLTPHEHPRVRLLFLRPFFSKGHQSEKRIFHFFTEYKSMRNIQNPIRDLTTIDGHPVKPMTQKQYELRTIEREIKAFENDRARRLVSTWEQWETLKKLEAKEQAQRILDAEYEREKKSKRVEMSYGYSRGFSVRKEPYAEE